MKRILALLLATLVCAALFAALVYAVLLSAHVAEPAATTVQGATARRLWATTAAALALVGVVVGGLTLARPSGRGSTRHRAIMALLVGLIATVNGALVVALADGGPGTGNGVVGGAGALVLGLIAVVLGTVTLARARCAAEE